MESNNRNGYFRDRNLWALILGGSSGIGLGAVRKLASSGMHIILVYREPRERQRQLESEMQALRQSAGVRIELFGVNALQPEGIREVVKGMNDLLHDCGRVRLLLHSIARGNLKPLVTRSRTPQIPGQEIGIADTIGNGMLGKEDFELTIYAMATSLLDWTRAILDAGLFGSDARLLGLSSEGSSRHWPGYSAVSVAKCALEGLARNMAVEFAPFGLRSNLIQAGTTDTPSLARIPGSERLKSLSQARNPFGRLTTPQDVADVIFLMALDEAAWINGALIHADGGEHCR